MVFPLKFARRCSRLRASILTEKRRWVTEDVLSVFDVGEGKDRESKTLRSASMKLLRVANDAKSAGIKFMIFTVGDQVQR